MIYKYIGKWELGENGVLLKKQSKPPNLFDFATYRDFNIPPRNASRQKRYF